MSYCRYDTCSGWYCYWCISDSNRREEQLFAIEPGILYTYKQIKEDLTGTLALLEARLNKDAWPEWKAGLEEMKGYMEEFIAEVEQDPELV